MYSAGLSDSNRFECSTKAANGFILFIRAYFYLEQVSERRFQRALVLFWPFNWGADKLPGFRVQLMTRWDGTPAWSRRAFQVTRSTFLPWLKEKVHKASSAKDLWLKYFNRKYFETVQCSDFCFLRCTVRRFPEAVSNGQFKEKVFSRQKLSEGVRRRVEFSSS